MRLTGSSEFRAGHLRQQRVAIIAAPRCGTHALGSILEQNGYTRFDEVLSPRHPSAPGHVDRANFQTFLRDRNVAAVDLAYRPREILSSYLDHLDGLVEGSFYIDLKLNSLRRISDVFERVSSPPLILTECIRRGYLFLHLVRQNGLARYLSAVIAQASGQYHMPRSEDALPVRVTVSVDECLRAVRENIELDQLTSRWLQPSACAKLLYEQTFVGGRLSDTAAHQLETFLGHPIPLRRSRLSKAERNLRSSIVNYAQLEAAVAGAGFGHMLPATASHNGHDQSDAPASRW